ANFHGHVILHWFSGTQKELERAHASGFYFSVNPSMTSSKSGQALIRRMDPARVLTETDGPFVTLRSTPAKPWQAVECLPFLAAAWGSTPGEAAERIDDNYAAIIRSVQQSTA